MKATQVLFGGRSRLLRLPLSTKNARKGYYKGNGSGHQGSWDPANPRRFVPDWDKVRTYIYPERGLEGFKLTPFVAKTVEKAVQVGENEWQDPLEKLTGEAYLQRWKDEGGHDVVAYDVPDETLVEKK